MVRTLYRYALIASLVVLTLGMPVRAQNPEPDPDHIRGQVASVDGSSIVVKTAGGKTVRLGLSDKLTVLTLSKGSFLSLDFGTYVGSVAVRLDIASPIVKAIPRDSANWLYQGYELRIIDEQLRGIAMGVKQWDLPDGSTMTHGWIDDIEGRVVSIKYGPTREEETDVLVSRDTPILKMSVGDRSQIKPGANVFVGGRKEAEGKYVAVFIFVGKDGIVPPL